ELSGVALGYAGIPFTVDGTRVDGMAFASPTDPSLTPPVVEGRAPTGADDIVLGTRTLTSQHLHLGETVAVGVEGGPSRRLRIVGACVFPTLSDALGLGHGALLTVAGLHAILGPATAPPPDHLFVRFRPGTAAAGVRELAQRVEPMQFVVLPAERPTDLVNFGRVQSLPLVLAAILASLAALTLVHLLVTSV